MKQIIEHIAQVERFADSIATLHKNVKVADVDPADAAKLMEGMRAAVIEKYDEMNEKNNTLMHISESFKSRIIHYVDAYNVKISNMDHDTVVAALRVLSDNIKAWKKDISEHDADKVISHDIIENFEEVIEADFKEPRADIEKLKKVIFGLSSWNRKLQEDCKAFAKTLAEMQPHVKHFIAENTKGTSNTHVEDVAKNIVHKKEERRQIKEELDKLEALIKHLTPTARPPSIEKLKSA